MKFEKIVENYLSVSNAADELADFMAVFSDRTRLKILCVLSMDDLCVNDISFILKTNQSTVSHQLRILKDCYLVNCYKMGKKTFYYIRNKKIENLLYHAVLASEE